MSPRDKSGEAKPVQVQDRQEILQPVSRTCLVFALLMTLMMLVFHRKKREGMRPWGNKVE